MPLDLDKVKAALSKIGPKRDYYCMALSVEAARVLILGPESKPLANIKMMDYKGSFTYEDALLEGYLTPKLKEQGKEIFPNITEHENFTPDQTQKFFFTIPSANAGTVFFVTTPDADHFYNIIKSDDNHIFLLDSDGNFYKRITTLEDFKITAKDLQGNEKTTMEKGYSYIGFDEEEAEEPIQLYKVGKLDEGWKWEFKKEEQITPEQPSEGEGLGKFQKSEK